MDKKDPLAPFDIEEVVEFAETFGGLVDHARGQLLIDFLRDNFAGVRPLTFSTTALNTIVSVMVAGAKSSDLSADEFKFIMVAHSLFMQQTASKAFEAYDKETNTFKQNKGNLQ